MNISTTTTVNPVNMYDYMNSFILNPTMFGIILLIIVAYIILFSSLGNNNQGSMPTNVENNSKTKNIIFLIMGVILVIILILNAFQYFFGINITASIKDFFSNKPVVDIIVDQTNSKQSPVPTIRFKKQVFNIPGNYYNYDNAKALCTAYGAKLATYSQLEESYKDGAEWCNYGWSEGQNAFFPTQQKTFDNLQKIKGHEHDCGRPGINGGYIANPNVQFGVNCYGHKPRITGEEEELMKVTTPYPETVEDKMFQKRVDMLKNKVDDILVSPFNYKNWGQM